MRLHPIKSGEIQLRVMNPRPPRRGPGKLPRTLLGSLFRKPQWYPVPVFLVEHPDAGPFLIDVGYDPSVSSDPTRTLGFVFGKVMMKHRVADRSVPEQVKERGIGSVGRLSRASDAPAPRPRERQCPVARGHIRRGLGGTRRRGAQRGPGPYVKSHLATIERWQDIDYAQAEPFESFVRTIDLFGDGTVRLISSPGHSPGHQSVLLRLRDRYALICGDAAMSTRELREPVIDGLVVDQDSYVRSGEEARAFMRAHPDTLAIPSHDQELWSRLDPVYE